jgi:hypothetical protein
MLENRSPNDPCTNLVEGVGSKDDIKICGAKSYNRAQNGTNYADWNAEREAGRSSRVRELSMFGLRMMGK